MIIFSMKALRVLHMSNTSRTLDNIPPTLDDLDNLQVHFTFFNSVIGSFEKVFSQCHISFLEHSCYEYNRDFASLNISII